MLVKENKKYTQILSDAGIDVRSCWPPAHQQEYHKSVLDIGSYPNADYVYDGIIDLPIGSGLEDEHIEYVIQVLKENGL